MGLCTYVLGELWFYSGVRVESWITDWWASMCSLLTRYRPLRYLGKYGYICMNVSLRVEHASYSHGRDRVLDALLLCCTCRMRTLWLAIPRINHCQFLRSKQDIFMWFCSGLHALESCGSKLDSGRLVDQSPQSLPYVTLHCFVGRLFLFLWWCALWAAVHNSPCQGLKCSSIRDIGPFQVSKRRLTQQAPNDPCWGDGWTMNMPEKRRDPES